jgi:hypothetical protein
MAQTTNVLGGGIAFNEIGYDSTGTPGFNTDNTGTSPTDGEDEFIEFINLSGSPINMTGFEVWETGLTTGPVYTFGSVTLNPGEKFVLLTDGGNLAGFQALNPGVKSDNGTTSQFNLNNSREEIVLVDPSSGDYITLTYYEALPVPSDVSSFAAFPGTTEVGSDTIIGQIADGQSLQRAPDGDDTFFVANATPGSGNTCFAPGTMIATPDGPVAVETLGIGDVVTTADNKTTRVKWIGRQTAKKTRLGENMEPVLIREGALGPNVPNQDLVVTADHGMIIDEMVINAGALVNHDTIDYIRMADLPVQMIFFHVETENHEVILANGAAAETFIDRAGRGVFDNYDEFLDLYGADRLIPEMPRLRITTSRYVPQAIRERLSSKHEITADLKRAG